MLGILNSFFDSNKKEINKILPLVQKINTLEDDVKKLKDSDFPKRTAAFKVRLANGEKVLDILPEAFALAREAARRTLGLRHFDQQLMGGIVLAEGKVAEQKTGEGKTLTAVNPLYLHSLMGKGAHLVTVNDYLARRDAGWMGPVFHMLGVSVAAMINDQSYLYDPEFINEQANDYRLVHLKPISRKEAYEADVTYGINSEFGFDYLRDNMAQDVSGLVQRGYYYAIVDEVDSVLIDEARTPHIISAPDDEPSQKYYEYAGVVEKLSPETDFKIDEKFRTAHLTDHGIGKVEKLYGIKDIYEKDFDTVYHLEAALKARTLFHREKDYIVKDNQVILVDEFTGRLLEGRRLSEGIHQAIEAKENVAIQRESKTLATVSLQNYFRMYEVLSGMTGTAVTEAEEFKKIYKLDVVVIPTYRPVKRNDLPDAVYKTHSAKYTAAVAEIESAYKKGQPVLVGTTSIDKNQIISEMLKRKKIKHQVLNAKNHLQEAQIIADAGKKGAVTVATNMAGRGVDIVLGGETPKLENGLTDPKSAVFKAWQKEHDEVLKLGGLYVIGTERHESRRIDNQLRGRSGRQGDAGASRFFVSLDDEIMRLFGGDRIAGIMERFKMPDDVPLEHPLVSRAIENAQVKVEGFNFDSRKHLVEYDDVLNKQREIIYALRRKLLENSVDEKSTLKEEVLNRVHTATENLVNLAVANGSETGTLNEDIVNSFSMIIPFDELSKEQLVKQLQQIKTTEEKTSFLVNLTDDVYAKREEQLGPMLMRQVEKYVMLSVIDNLWMNHLDAIDNLRQGIGLRGYAQRDPLVEYKNEAFRMFEQLMYGIDDEIVRRIYKVQVQQPGVNPPHGEPGHVHDTQTHTHADGTVHNGPAHPENPLPAPKKKKMMTNTPESEVSEAAAKPIENKAKLSRNDPCWCGSGKKWKKCHYPQTEA